MSTPVTVEISHVLWLVGVMTAIIGAMLRFSIGQVERRLDEKFTVIHNQMTSSADKISKAELADADNKLETARLERDLMGIRLEMAENYVKAAELSNVRMEIQSVRSDLKSGLDKIFDKLDTKVSRDDCNGCRP